MISSIKAQLPFTTAAFVLGIKLLVGDSVSYAHEPCADETDTSPSWVAHGHDHAEDVIDTTSNPSAMEKRIALAQQFLNVAARTGDHSYTDRAAEMLADANSEEPKQRLFLAVIAERRHRFQDALKRLDALLETHPSYAEAWFRRGSLRLSLGHLSGALKDCHIYYSLRPTLAGAGCLAQALAATGQANAARDLLTRHLQHPKHPPNAPIAWAWSQLADIHERLGTAAKALTAHEQALKHVAFDAAASLPIVEAAGWFHLRRNALTSVQDVTHGKPATPGILILLSLSDADASCRARYQRQLEERLHQADAYPHPEHLVAYYLHIKNEPETALFHARRLWQQRQAPDTSRIYAEAAHAAGANEDLATIGSWLHQHQAEDARLERYLTGAIRRN